MKTDDFLQKLKKMVRIVLYGLAIDSQSDCRNAGRYQLQYNNMLLLTNCEVHTGKYLDRSLDLRTERSERSVRKTKIRIFSRMDRNNWSIRALLYSHNQH